MSDDGSESSDPQQRSSSLAEEMGHFERGQKDYQVMSIEYSQEQEYPTAPTMMLRRLVRDYKTTGIVGLCIVFLYVTYLTLGGGGGDAYNSTVPSSSTRQLMITTWNVAAINNNVFEYWLTVPDDPNYEKLMVDVEQFIDNPGERDVPVSEVFTPAMFDTLDARLTKLGWKSLRQYWQDEFMNRRIVNDFLKDATLGSKRLVSMPDRYTNLIRTANGDTVFRPTIISMYEGDLGTQDKWWTEWQKFMFDTQLPMDDSGKTKAVWQIMQPIKKSKYPAITEQEEIDSLPLQTLSVAIFDAILVNMMNTLSTPSIWQPMKRRLVQSLVKTKIEKTFNILWDKYRGSDIITMEEVSSGMIEYARNWDKIADTFTIVTPKDLDAVRDQNSVILLRKTTFPKGSLGEITSAVIDAFPPNLKVPVADGDINAIRTVDADGMPYVIVAFHGDTNGLATIPVLDAIVKAMKDDPKLRNHRLIFGLDANTYEKGIPDKTQDVLEWAEHYTSYGLTSCWGDTPNPKNYTTYNARTFLQPQLNKACRKDGVCSHADINPKDFIIFPKEHYRVVRTWKDNTGQKKYEEGMAFPTLNFPSDHGLLATIIQPPSLDRA